MDPFNAKLVAAATGSAMTALTMTPFDVVKTRLQTQRPASAAPLFPTPPRNICCQPGTTAASCVRNMSTMVRPLAVQELVCIWDGAAYRTERVNGFTDAVRHVWKAEGLRGLWKGTGTTLAIGVPSATAYMLTYDYLQHQIMPHLLGTSTWTPLFAGMVARASVTSVVSPLELIRTNLQSTPISPDKPNTLSSVLSSLRQLTRTNGVQHLWRGLGATLWRDVPFSGLYWASYETGKRILRTKGYDGAPAAFASGATSGILAALVTSPFDVLKTRRQAMIMSGSTSTVSGSLSLVREIVQTEGLSTLFTGLGPRMVKIAPACGIMIACYEGIGRALMAKPSEKSESTS